MADTPKIDDASAARLGHMFVEMAHGKERRTVAKAVRAHAPGSPEARSFADVEQEERFEAFKAEQEQKEVERQRGEVLANMERQKRRLLSGGEDGSGRKYSEDDMKAIEALMQKKGMIDYEDAATLYAATLPPDSPKPGRDIPESHGATWEFPEWAKFGPDPVKASRDTANQVITELMRQRR
jgi:hypothetical protein